MSKWFLKSCTVSAAVALSAPAIAQFFPRDDPPPRRDCPAKLAEKDLIDCLLGQMTLAEKADYVAGQGFETNGVRRLDIPAIRMSDGPKGVRTDGYPTTTAFPSGVSLASTWNPGLVTQAASAMGEEASVMGISVLLGPGVNIQRYPLGGRNFEYYSEDPILSGVIGVGWVKGVQSQGVAASPKHFAANNQETNRFWNNSVVDERSLREIYFPQFEKIVREAQPWIIMSSYNRVSGTFVSQNRWLLTDVLRKEWGFDGIVVSDWTGLHDTAGGMNAGNDLEMPVTKYYGSRLVDAVQVKSVEMATLDESVRRIMRLQIRTSTLQSPRSRNTESALIGNAAHRALAQKVAEESLVLLKNEGGLLPLRRDARVAFIRRRDRGTSPRGLSQWITSGFRGVGQGRPPAGFDKCGGHPTGRQSRQYRSMAGWSVDPERPICRRSDRRASPLVWRDDCGARECTRQQAIDRRL